MLSSEAMTTALLESPVQSPFRRSYQGRAMTVDQFLRLPDDGVRRELLGGIVEEEDHEDGMSYRSRQHALTNANTARELGNWSRTQPEPRGEVVDGDAGFILSDEGSAVGIDVAYVSPEQSQATPPGQQYFHGSPVLAVEIISPSDTIRKMKTKVRDYLAAGVEAVWYLDPDDRTLTIHQRDREARVLRDGRRVENEPYLPGFAVDVAVFFDK